ncbi:MAG: MBL fold metallo-hydrolase [Clostridia bacterium]|nr:MBL fold metallo-hydrolase [Clostridia bacterium]
MLEAYTLYSGSSGNCIYVKGKDAQLLFDAGKSARAIQTALASINTDLSKIDAIFVTHEHGDHVGGLEMISKKHRIPVHITAPSYANYVREGTYLSQVAAVHDVVYGALVGGLKIYSFPIPHDAAQNVGYIIEDSDGDRVGIATDIGFVTEDIVKHLTGCPSVIIESNHDIKMVKSGPYPAFLKERILSKRGHLSNDECSRLCVHLAQNGTNHIGLAHLSRENNTPLLAYSKTKDALNENGYGDVCLRVASPESVVRVTGEAK